MQLVIAGGTGFVGNALCRRLLEQGHSLTLLSRYPAPREIPAKQNWVTWQPGLSGSWEKEVDGADAVINLAGQPIAAKRWTEAQKERIRASRVDSTRAIVAAMGRAGVRPKLLLNASAVGIYGPHGDEELTESDAPGSDFLSRVCVEWEDEARRAEDHSVRVVLLRTGIVLGAGGGALAKMLLPFRFFAGGPLGNGRQWMSWIQMEDEIGLILHLLQHPAASGAVNATAPNPVAMKEFCRTLGRVLQRPSWAPAPAFALRLLLGEMADMLLIGQRVLPARAGQLGYSFKYANLPDALVATLRRSVTDRSSPLRILLM
ncbi:MAG: TIGR01777 family oxidoreductase [Candidatus Binatia bacterium]|nr:TIGR01777 family oxidoreductase [Candidatus Binatia bacterium]